MIQQTLSPRRRPLPWLAVAVVSAALLSACTAGGTDPTPDAASPSATPTPTPEPSSAPAAPADDAAPVGDGGPVDAFHTWLAASRAPDAATACDYMTPALQDKMIGELAGKVPGIEDCTSFIEMTAGLYAASGQSSETVVELREETADRAVLHVTYAAGTCGLVVLQPGNGHWVLDERSQEEC